MRYIGPNFGAHARPRSIRHPPSFRRRRALPRLRKRDRRRTRAAIGRLAGNTCPLAIALALVVGVLALTLALAIALDRSAAP